MNRIKNILWLSLIIITLAIGVACGDQIDTSENITQDSSIIEPVKRVDILFYDDFTHIHALGRMNEAINNRIKDELKTEIGLGFMKYDVDLLLEFTQTGHPDAFQIDASDMIRLVSEGALMDISELFPAFAPEYYLKLMDTWDCELDFLCKYDGKMYGIPNNNPVIPRYCVMAKEELVDKYMPEGIRDLDDYGDFLIKVRLNERDVYPCCLPLYDNLASSRYIDAFMTGNGYYHLHDMFILGRWYDSGINPVFLHETMEFDEACKKYDELQRQDVFYYTSDPYYTQKAFINGEIASMLYYMPTMQQVQKDYIKYLGGRNYKIYPLYMDKTYLRSREVPFKTDTFIGISSKSDKADRVLKFIEWLHSSQENYDLFMYGLQDKNYVLTGNKLDFTDSSPIAGWQGSDVFRDYLLERPYQYEPDDYKVFIKDSMANMMTRANLYTEKGYDIAGYFSVYSGSDRRIEYETVYGQIQSHLVKYAFDYYSFCNSLDRGVDKGKPFSEIVNEKRLQNDIDMIRTLLKTELKKMKQ